MEYVQRRRLEEVLRNLLLLILISAEGTASRDRLWSRPFSVGQVKAVAAAIGCQYRPRKVEVSRREVREEGAASEP